MGESCKTYQAKDGYIHRKVTGMDVLIPVGENIANFNGCIELNESAAFLWKQLSNPQTLEELEEKLVAEFEIDLQQAKDDVWDFVKKLHMNNMVVVK